MRGSTGCHPADAPGVRPYHQPMRTAVQALIPAALMMAALAYAPARIGLTVMSRRAERRGDIEQAQELRRSGFMLLLGMIVLVLMSVIALGLTAF